MFLKLKIWITKFYPKQIIDSLFLKIIEKFANIEELIIIFDKY